MTKKTCLDLHRDSVLVPISSFMKDSSCPFLNDLNENANGRGFCIVRSWGFDDGKMADPDTNDLTNLTRSESSQESDGNGAFNESASVELETIFVIPKYDDAEALPKDVEADLLKSYDDEESDEAFSFHESDADDDEESDENETFNESDDDEESDQNEAFHQSGQSEGFAESDQNEGFHESHQSEGFAESKKEDEDETQEEYEDVFAPYLHLWDSCEKCETAHYKEHLIKEMNVCVNCGAHLKMNSSDRIGVLVDPTTFDPMDEKLNSIDAIEWDSEAVLYAWKVCEKKLQKEWEFHEKEMKGFRDNFSFSWKAPKAEDSEEYWDLDLYDFYLKKFELKGKASGRSEDCLEGAKATERDSFREEILQMYPELLPDESEKALLEKLKELPDESQEELEARLEELELQRKSEEELLEKSQRDLLEKYHLLVEKSQQDLDLLEKSQQDLLEKYHQALDLLEKSRKEVLEKLETYRRVLAELSKDAVFKLTLKSIYRVFLEGYYREWVRHETGKFPEEQFKKDIEEEENVMEIEEEEIEEEEIEEEEIEEEEEKLRKMSKEKLVALLRIFSKFLARRPKFDKYKYKEIWKNVGFWVDDLIYAWAILEARQDLMNENWKKHFRFEGTDPFSFWFKLQDRQHFSSMTKEEEVFEYGMSWKEYRRRVLYKCTAIACWEKERNKELAQLKKDSEEEKTSQDREGDSCKERKVIIFGISDIPEILEKAFSKIDRTLSRVWEFVDEMAQERDRVESEKRFFDGIVEPEEEEDIEDETYHERLARYKSETGLLEAIQTGKAEINGLPVLFGSMEFGFMGGSMGSVVGEKVARLIERATSEFLPLIIVCASGGARMQEGIFSLMQMAKISGTLYSFRQRSNQKKKLLYISILASPTTGGVLASFGMLADLVLSEPQTSIAFAGARVIEAILHETVPEGSQEAEPLMEKGMLDGIIERKLLKYYVAFLFDFHNLYSFLYGNSDD